MKLRLYNKKRDFRKTPEPKGKLSHQHKNLYVIQKHAASHLHYDFRLELHGVLLSWAVPKGPCLDPSVKRLAMHVEDHPVEYGSFEGIIPKGEYGGGTVMLWDTGNWVSEDENPSAAYQRGHLRFQLKGKKLKGRWSLIRFKSAGDQSWFLVKSKDRYAKLITEYDITIKKPNSILTKYNLEKIAEQYQNVWSKKGLKKIYKPKKKSSAKSKIKVPKFKINLPKSSYPSSIFPELATLVSKPPEGADWIHEIKLDGYRILAFLKNKKIRLMSRNNKEWTHYFSFIANSIKKFFSKNLIFDGEIVLLDKDKRSNFQLLQNAMDTEEHKQFIYYIFDIIYYDKYDLTLLPLKERKNILHQILLSVNNSNLQYSDHILGTGEEVFKTACEMSLEGIISKNINSLYEQKRTKRWVKIKCTRRQEFVICGFTPPQGTRRFFGSLYLGYYDKKGQLVYCGNVGTGFTENSLLDVYQEMKKHIINENPFATRPPGITSAIWVKPMLVCEVEFSEWTQDGSLRHPSFKGLRKDKKPNLIAREIELKVNSMPIQKKPKVAEEKTGLTYKLTHPNKVLYPESKITKSDIAKYYEEIQDWILPYIVNRPLTIVRCPDNYKKCFYQKHIINPVPNILYGIPIKEKNKTDEYIYIKDVAGLMALVQMGSLEIHPWGSRVDKVEYPDMITIDLDPSLEVAWKKVVWAAKQIRDYLKQYKLTSFIKTTGGKGLHVVIPIKPEYKWDVVKEFTHSFVNFLVAEHPKEYVSEMSKQKRKGKIFVDYLRNQRGATSVSAYSTRARVNAPVSTPLDWDELTNQSRDTLFTIKTVPNRLKQIKKDPWKEFFKTKQSLRLGKK
jgi:bifunctional non-homologous end joining protein LigD